MTSDLAERLRRANPVPASAAGAPDEGLLSRIVATPRVSTERPWRRPSRRRAVTLLAAAVVVVGGLAAAASKFAPQYFGADDREPTPAAVLTELRSYAQVEVWGQDDIEALGRGVWGEIDEAGVVRLAAFDTASGRATIYAAPLKAGSGLCYVHAIGEEIRGSGCDAGANAIEYSGHGSSDWGDARAFLGWLNAPASGIEVRFEDGAVRAASVRAPLWVYVVGGDETEPGQRPVELLALDAGGVVVATQQVDPYYYTSRHATEALLPEGDGSRGQNAILAALEGLGAGPQLEQGVQIERTRLLRRIETDKGALDVYVAPWGAGGVCFGYATSIPGFDPVIRGCTWGRIEDQPTDFDPDLINIVRLAPSISMVEGAVPLDAASMRLRFEDGTTEEPDIFTASSFAAWLGPERLVRGHRPTELVALDANGHELSTFRLEPEQFRPR